MTTLGANNLSIHDIVRRSKPDGTMAFTNDGVLFVNPGSPTLPMQMPGTVAVLDLSKKVAAAKIVSV